MQRHHLFSLNNIVLMFLALVFLVSGCDNQFISQPTFAPPLSSDITSSATDFAAPTNIKSTQGGYREITLSWNPVKDAERYNVYHASTQFDTFVQVGETTGDKTSLTMKVVSGTDRYYRVTAVSHSGEESPFSTIVRGTSLATPLISAIEGVKDLEDNSVTVSWYMSNADAYQDQVRYEVFCIDGKNQVVGEPKSPELGKTEVTFDSLSPNSAFQYRVEAYHVSADTKREISPIVDAATARRLRPNAPENLTVAKGMSKDSIEISFVLPDEVDVAISGGKYEQAPLYFKLYRREWKEDAESNTTDYQLVAEIGPSKTADGSVDYTKVDFGAGAVDYTPGQTVTYSDTAELKNDGTKYEYYLQSYAYVERVITSDDSRAFCPNPGWLMQDASFKIQKYEQQVNEKGLYDSATLDFQLDWDNMGLDDQYTFQLREERWCLESDNDTNRGVSELKDEKIEYFASVDEVNNYIRTFDFSETGITNVRGYYKYTFYILTPAQSEYTNAEIVVPVFGQLLVTNQINLPSIQSFAVTSGLEKQVSLEWSYVPDYQYTLKYKENVEGAEEQTVTHEQLFGTTEGTSGDAKIEGTLAKYTHNNLEDGKSYLYILSAYKDVTVSTDSLEAITAKTPVISLKETSYDKITIEWDDQIANEFVISAKYTDAAASEAHKIEGTSIKKPEPYTISPNRHSYTIDKPAGYNDGSVAGKEIEIQVTVSSNEVKTTLTNQGSYYERSENKLKEKNLSGKLKVHTLGPNAADVKTAAADTTSLSVTWNEVQKAEAYAVIRSRMHISPESSVGNVKYSFQNTDIYIVTPTETGVSVELQGSSDKPDAGIVSVAKKEAADGAPATFTLTDKVLETVPAEGTRWAESQSQIDWGAPYQYIVMPLAKADDSISYDYETSQDKVTVGAVEMSKVRNYPISTTGYCWNVQATKGTYASDSDTKKNDAVLVSWISNSASPSYTVYRRQENTESWETVTASATGSTYKDETAEPGTVYEYMAAAANTNPTEDKEYLEFSRAIQDTDYPDERSANGFILPIPEITSVSRDAALGTTKEKVKWPAIRIGGKPNRMISGYVVEVMNNNIDAEWHEITRVTFSSDTDKKNYYELDVENKDDLLKVLRDYKHYFRIRAYTNGPDGEVLSPEPEYTWSDGAETAHVKWGARQLTLVEFAKIALTSLVEPIETVRGSGSGNWDDGDERKSSDGKFVTTGWYWGWTTEMVYESTYNDYTAHPMTKSGRRVSAMTLQGQLNGRGGATGAFPYRWWTATDVKSNNITSITVNYPALNTQGFISLTGGWQGTYSWQASYGTSRSAGTIKVEYNGESWDYNSTSELVTRLPLPLNGDGDFSTQYNTDYWK